VVFVLVGVGLAIARVHDFVPVLQAWGLLKPAHAWLNLIGFVGVTLAATYVHLVPTVLGARIGMDRLAALAVGGLAVGVTAVSAGFIVASDVLVRLGGALALVGALAVPAYALAEARQPGRGRWTTELGWHRFTTWSLVASGGWLATGVGAAALSVVVHGASAAAWSLALVGVPVVIGGALQAIVAAGSHLVPAFGSGTPAARQRLGRGATGRVVAWQAGTAGAWAATMLALDGAVALASAALLAIAAGSAVLGLASVVRLRAK
jgi:nitrite reductase (NO-forming)